MKSQSNISRWTYRLVLLAMVAGIASSAFVPEYQGGANSKKSTAAASFSQLNLYPNIETAGVVVSGTDLPKTANLIYRQTGETNWRTGHPLMRSTTAVWLGVYLGLPL